MTRPNLGNRQCGKIVTVLQGILRKKGKLEIQRETYQTGNMKKPKLTPDSYTMVRLWTKLTLTIAGGLQLLNNHRLGVLRNLTIAEYANAQETDKGDFVVFTHKTFGTGPATILINNHLKPLTDDYLQLRKQENK